MKRSAEQKIAERRRCFPKSLRGVYSRAMAGKSRKAGIHAMCVHCVGPD